MSTGDLSRARQHVAEAEDAIEHIVRAGSGVPPTPAVLAQAWASVAQAHALIAIALTSIDNADQPRRY